MEGEGAPAEPSPAPSPAIAPPSPVPSPAEPAFSFPRWPQSWWAALLRWALHWLLLRSLTAWFSGRAPVTGLANLSAVPGPVLLVANHLTAIDGALLVGRLPWSRSRKIAIAMSGEILRDYRHPSPSLPWFERLALRVQYVLVLLVYQVFPLPRSGGVRRAFQHAGRLADAGYSVLVFPEGRRSETGELLPFQPGTGILARDVRQPVVPVWLEGIQELREKGRRRARAGEVSLRIGPPLEFNATEDTVAVTAAVEDAVRRLGSL